MEKNSNHIVDQGNKQFIISEKEIKDLIRTQQDYIAGKTSARDWVDIEKDLEQLYG